jgi:mRNA interferase RelE/StbE
MARVVLLSDAKEDIAGLDGSARRRVFRKLVALQTSPEQQGQPLGGQLTGFRELAVAGRQNRIVYRIEPSGDVVVVWVVGSRVDSECYDLAAARLALYADGEMAGKVRGLLDAAFASDNADG